MKENRCADFAPRRSGALGIHSLDHFEMQVPDLGAAERFYRTFGLQVRREGQKLGVYAAEPSQRWLRIHQGSAKKLSKICFRAYPEDMAALRARCIARGLTPLDRSDDTPSIYLRDPDGTLVQICAGPRLRPDEKAPFAVYSSPAGEVGACNRANAPVSAPRHLSHLAIFTADVDAAIDFYCGALGLAVADRSGSALAFLHGVHGSDHHILALAKSAGPGMHHCSWDMGSIDAIELAAARIRDAGYGEGWGLGRHVLGSNYFHYIRDPWGSYCEYTADIDYIPADCNWRDGDHPADDAMFLWGPTPPPDFIVNRELDAVIAGATPSAVQQKIEETS